MGTRRGPLARQEEEAADGEGLGLAEDREGHGALVCLCARACCWVVGGPGVNRSLMDANEIVDISGRKARRLIVVSGSTRQTLYLITAAWTRASCGPVVNGAAKKSASGLLHICMSVGIRCDCILSFECYKWRARRGVLVLWRREHAAV